MAASKKRAAGGATDPFFANVVLLCNFESGITDVTGKTPTLYGGIGVSGGAAVFDGVDNAIDWSDSPDFDLGTGDFTVEWFFERSGAFPQIPFFIGFRATGVSDGFHVTGGVNAANVLRFVMPGGLTVEGTTQLNDGVDRHLAICRSGSTVRMFVAGVNEGEGVSTGNIVTSGNRPRIGANDFPASPTSNVLAGSMHALRITKGVARYTANFTPPTDPFPEA